MKLLVTGGAGFIGSAVVRMALGQGHEVLCIDKLTYAGNLDNLAPVADHPAFRFEQADICDGPLMDALIPAFAPEAVLHLAAESHVDRSIDGPMAFVETNVVGTVRLLEAARAARDSGALPEGFRFVHVSTDEVFGSLGPQGKFSETSPYDPNSPYSASKAASDHFARAWGETFGLPVIVTNCSNNYGPYQHPEKLIPVAVLSALRGDPIPIYGDGQNVRDWLFVDDHARALLTVAEKGEAGETYIIGGNAERTNLELVHAICAVLDRLVPEGAPHDRLITFVTDRPGHDRRYAMDASFIRAKLGWEPRATLDSGLEETIRWIIDNRDWCARALGTDAPIPRRGLGG